MPTTSQRPPSREVSKVEAAASLWRAGDGARGGPRPRSGRRGRRPVRDARRARPRGAARGRADAAGPTRPAVGALVDAYDLRGDGRWPSDVGDGAARPRSPGRKASATTRRPARSASTPGVTLDLDGIAKGFALDRAAAALRARGVDDALLNFGGQLLAIGPPPARPAREALVGFPGRPRRFRSSSVRLRDASLSTSANSERVRTVAGKEAGHLLDPRTGISFDLPGSVTVLALDAARSPTPSRRPGPSRDRRLSPGPIPARRSGGPEPWRFALAGP